MQHLFITMFLIASTLLTSTYSQSSNNPINLASFDKYSWHPGFIIAYTHASFLINREPDFDFSDSLVSITPKPTGAFAFGLVFSLDFNKNIHLRSGTTLSFQDRQIKYVFLLEDSLQTFDKKIQSVYTEIPLTLKLRTDRINNYTLYVTGGIKYGYDWASQINVKESFNYEDIVKIKKSNLAATVGGGIDFFLPYFKFGIDLTYGVGINNVNVKNNTYFSNPIHKMRTQVWQLSFTFEG